MERVGRYEILNEIGQGGMATVYLARQPDLDRLVALKELGVLRAADAELARRFLREARMAGALSHPNVVTVHDYFEDGGTPFIAMEHVAGGSLRGHVGARRPIAQIGGALDGLLQGLAHAESHGIVHRDLKPENVLVAVDGHVKIADFGIAKAGGKLLTVASLTATGTTMGTPAYMAPEQALGDDVSPRTDLYAVGVIAFELLVGRQPFADTEAPMAVLMRQINDPIPAVHSIRPDVDPRLSDWVARLVEKDARDRTASAAEAREELEDLVLALAGPRWRRDAALPVTAAGMAVSGGPGTAATPVMSSRATWDGDSRTRAPRASAMGPAVVAPAAAAGARAATRRRVPRVVTAAFVAVALVAALAAALNSRSDAPPTGTVNVEPSRETAPQASTTPPAAATEPSPAATAPAPATTAPAPAPAAAPAPQPAAPAPASSDENEPDEEEPDEEEPDENEP